jgi:hypothetical protein
MIFDPRFFINQSNQGFEFAKKFYLEIVKIGFRSLNETTEADFLLMEFSFNISIFFFVSPVVFL